MDFQASTRSWGVNSGRSEDGGSGRDRWGADHARSGRWYAPRLPGKDGKEHRYFSIGENKRVSGARVLQRHVLYLGEINSSQELAWRKSIEVLEEGDHSPRTLSLFPEDHCGGVLPDESVVRLRLAQLRLERPRQWGGCW